jgi:hypothetical protein
MRLNSTAMRLFLVIFTLFLFAACASESLPENPDAQIRKDVKARDEFARTLPKPPER